MHRNALLALLAVTACLLAPVAAWAQTPWIHVEVTEPGKPGKPGKEDSKDTHVKVNLPLSVVQVAIDAAPEEFVSEGRIHLHHMDQDIHVEDLRRMWNDLRNAGDAEFVTVEDDDETVTVKREGELILIHVDDLDDGEKVRIEVPIEVMDALLSGEGESLNLKEALTQLRGRRGDLVRVDDGETKVRVWIDERS